MNIRRSLYTLSGMARKLIVPELRYSQDLYEDVLRGSINEESVWLDLGCGHHVLSPWKTQSEKDLIKTPLIVIGLDYDMLSLKKHRTIQNRVRGDVSTLPFADNTFSLVTSNMVFEHLADPEHQLREICRVMKHGGRLIFHTPNKWGYDTILARLIPEVVKSKLISFLQERIDADVFPAYYRINTARDIIEIATASGYEVERIKHLSSLELLAMVPPLPFLELLWIKVTLMKWARPLRSNIIAFLQKN